MSVVLGYQKCSLIVYCVDLVSGCVAGLTGVDLLMYDLKALEAYASYFYYLSKVWSNPLPEVYDPQDVAQYFSVRPHVVTFRVLEVLFYFIFYSVNKLSG